MRDVAEEGGITDVVRFRKFLNACAALTAEQVNYRTLAEAAEISQPTAKEWVRILQGLGILYLLPPFANNELKRNRYTYRALFLRHRPVRLPVHVAHQGHPDAGGCQRPLL